MAMNGKRTFVGFGFGAIQAGLFLYEAYGSGAFGQLVVAEVLSDVVAAVRRAGGYYRLNIAHADRIEQVEIGPAEIVDPGVKTDREQLVEALAQAEEIATAVPSVNFYTSSGPGSLHRLLAAGLRQKARQDGPRAVIYAAENHNHAAEILEERVMGEIPTGERDSVRAQVRFLNTVIGKMSGVVSEPAQITEQSLATITPGLPRAFLVEAFNRILISTIHFDDQPAFQRGIRVFAEKSNLLPFEEAKLFGHNATHALAAYLGSVRGVETIADLKDIPGMITFIRRAFIEESGTALVHKYRSSDPLFTPEGYTIYADDLLERMTNPFLHDLVERVGRDPERKLGWDDRLVGTIRMASKEGVMAQRYAFGAAAALARLEPQTLTQELSPASLLEPIWRKSTPDLDLAECSMVLGLIGPACQHLRHWKQAGFPGLDSFSLAG